MEWRVWTLPKASFLNYLFCDISFIICKSTSWRQFEATTTRLFFQSLFKVIKQKPDLCQTLSERFKISLMSDVKCKVRRLLRYSILSNIVFWLIWFDFKIKSYFLLLLFTSFQHFTHASNTWTYILSSLESFWSDQKFESYKKIYLVIFQNLSTTQSNAVVLVKSSLNKFYPK